MVGCLRAWVAALLVVVAGCTTSISGPSEGPASAPASQAATPSVLPSVDPGVTPSPSEASGTPAEPTGVTFAVVLDERDDGSHVYTHTVTWRTPRSEAFEIRVYGVTECLAEPTPLPEKEATGPCVVEGAPLPSSAIELATTALASDGTARWTWIDEEPARCGDIVSEYGPDGTGYYAVVLGAYNEAGHSVFAIAEPGAWQSYAPGTDLQIC